jgi:hypothetical protein
MGLKRRTFTGTLKVAILQALPRGTSMSRKALLERLRAAPGVSVSNRSFTLATKRLHKEGRLSIVGKRARLRFARG